jgi:hypothetical protein
MIYVRGNKADFDEYWERQHGCKGWNFDNLVEYFKKSEGCELPKEEVDEKLHGFDGPLKVTRSTMGEPNPISYLFVKACEALGLGRGSMGEIKNHDDGEDESMEAFDRVVKNNGHGGDYNGLEQYGASTVQVR